MTFASRRSERGRLGAAGPMEALPTHRRVLSPAAETRRRHSAPTSFPSALAAADNRSPPMRARCPATTGLFMTKRSKTIRARYHKNLLGCAYIEHLRTSELTWPEWPYERRIRQVSRAKKTAQGVTFTCHP